LSTYDAYDARTNEVHAEVDHCTLSRRLYEILL